MDKKPIVNADGLIQNSPTPSAATATGTLTVDQLDIDILPIIYDIVRCVEKDSTENNAKQRESAECSQKVLELQKRFTSARAQIKQLPGIEYTKDEQLQQLELLRSQLEKKQQLLRKYKDKQF